MTRTTLFPPDTTDRWAVPADPLISSDSAPPAPRTPPPFVSGRGGTADAVEVRTALTRPERDADGRGRSFDWSADPYRGCEIGFGNDGAQFAHSLLDRDLPGHQDPAEFETTVYAKRGFARALREDLRRQVQPGEHVAFGTATDPYQPLEERERVTRAALRELARAEGLRVSITTKSTLITRDLDILRRIAQRNALHVNITATTIDRRLARLLEPRAPDPRARLRTVRALRQGGIQAGLFVMPLLPGVTDSDVDLNALLRDAREVGAQWVGSQVVFLREPTRALFVRRLRDQYPRVAARYEVWTRYRAHLPESVRDDALDRLRAIARRRGLASGPQGDLPVPARPRQIEFGFSS